VSFIELLLIGISLAMDAFAVSIGKGLSVSKIEPKHVLCVGLWFGGFQALMPVIGYFVGINFVGFVSNIDHWIAFGLLAVIGANMIRESLSDDDGDDDDQNADFSVKAMVLLAIATSIDALAVGVSFAMVDVNIVLAATVIGAVTFAISAIGLLIGKKCGDAFKSKAEILGGIVLIAIGIKILVEHLFF